MGANARRNVRPYDGSEQTTGVWRIDEDVLCCCRFHSFRTHGMGPRLSAASRSRSALFNGVLLQDSVGTPAGVPQTVLEEPLPVAEEADGNRANPVRQN